MFLRRSRRRRGGGGARGFTDGGNRRPFVSPAGPFLLSFFRGSGRETETAGEKEESSGKNDGPLATVVRDQVSLLPTTSVGDVTLTRWTREPVSVSLCGSSRSLFFPFFFSLFSSFFFSSVYSLHRTSIGDVGVVFLLAKCLVCKCNCIRDELSGVLLLLERCLVLLNVANLCACLTC